MSGLKYMVLKKGTGTVSPKPTDTVKVYYIGTLLDGTVFDKAVEGEGQPPKSFRVDGVIKGWTEGLQLMKVGDKFKFEIPASLAYGATSRPGIPANSTLIFEVELLEIE
jgi:FKBP-type peptidyl-prolyl cis-trans isomerase